MYDNLTKMDPSPFTQIIVSHNMKTVDTGIQKYPFFSVHTMSMTSRWVCVLFERLPKKNSCTFIEGYMALYS